MSNDTIERLVEAIRQKASKDKVRESDKTRQPENHKLSRLQEEVRDSLTQGGE